METRPGLRNRRCYGHPAAMHSDEAIVLARSTILPQRSQQPCNI